MGPSSSTPSGLVAGSAGSAAAGPSGYVQYDDVDSKHGVAGTRNADLAGSLDNSSLREMDSVLPPPPIQQQRPTTRPKGYQRLART